MCLTLPPIYQPPLNPYGIRASSPRATSGPPEPRSRGDARRRSASARSTSWSTARCPRRSATARRSTCPPGCTEAETLARLRGLADRNEVLTSLIGQGYSDTITPPVIQRNVLENPAWYTAYTPYQPEISQGRLEALLNFQTMVSDLTAMDLANASLLDEPTAAAEAMAMLAPGEREGGRRRSSSTPSATRRPSRSCAPGPSRSASTWSSASPTTTCRPKACSACCCSTRAPPAWSATTATLVANLHAQGTLVAVAADLLALVLLAPPGEWGADVVVGSAQRFGVPMGYGGPHAGFFATRDEYKRNLPGRLVGVSVDAAGRPALRLALQTREQHIRREKATSNICTAQVLLANIAGMYAVYHGPDGLRAIAERVHGCAALLFRELRPSRLRVRRRPVLRHPRGARRRRGRRASRAGARRGHQPAPRRRRHRRHRARRDDAPSTPSPRCSPRSPVATSSTAAVGTSTCSAPTALRRTSEILTHPVFRTYHSETQMLRYLRALADRDLALDRTMIPLGSCTMKLNATAEMMPITWPEFADLHPFAPGRPGRGLRRAVRRARSRAVRDHRVRRGVAAAQRGLAGRARRPARDPRRTTRARGEDARDGVPHPRVGARHQRGERGDGRHARRRGEVRRRRQRRLRRPQGQGPRARRRSRRADGHVPVDPRRVRGEHPRRVRGRARVRRPGVPRRRQPQRARRPRQAGQVRRRRVAPQPAQDVLHPARWGRAGRRPGRGARAPRAVPARSTCRARRTARRASCRSRARTSR